MFFLGNNQQLVHPRGQVDGFGEFSAVIVHNFFSVHRHAHFRVGLALNLDGIIVCYEAVFRSMDHKLRRLENVGDLEGDITQKSKDDQTDNT